MVEEREEEDVEFDISRLEKYTERVPNEVLRVHATVDGEEDQVIIFKVKSISFLSFLFHAIWKERFGQDAHTLYLLLPFWLGFNKLEACCTTEGCWEPQPSSIVFTGIESCLYGKLEILWTQGFWEAELHER